MSVESPELKRICVFCGSHFGTDPAYRVAAIELGERMVERGLGLVYGGGDVGLMGVVADTMLAAGEYLTLVADANAEGGSIALGFSLNEAGDDVHLSRPLAAGGGLVDSLTFGRQYYSGPKVKQAACPDRSRRARFGRRIGGRDPFARRGEPTLGQAFHGGSPLSLLSSDL